MDYILGILIITIVVIIKLRKLYKEYKQRQKENVFVICNNRIKELRTKILSNLD